MYTQDIKKSQSQRFKNYKKYKQIFLDVTSEVSIKTAFNKILEDEKIDILINNAAIDAKVKVKIHQNSVDWKIFLLNSGIMKLMWVLLAHFYVQSFGNYFSKNGEVLY